MSNHIKVQKPKTTVGQDTPICYSAVVIHYKMGETRNRGDFKDETRLQFTPVPTKKRQTGKLERITLFVPNLGTALLIGKNFNMSLGGCEPIFWQIAIKIVNRDLQIIQKSTRITLLCRVI